MRRLRKSTFRPALEAAEARLLTTGGIAAHVAPHPEPAPAPVAPLPVPALAHAVVSAEAHHARPAVHHPSKASHHTTPATPSTSACNPAGPGHRATSPPYVAEAWVKLVNMTGSTVPYQISLAPYQDGKYLNFTIPSGYPNPSQYQYASLTASGPGSVANFKIRFSGTPPTYLTTGPSQATAPGYSIFIDSNGLYYVSLMIP